MTDVWDGTHRPELRRVVLGTSLERTCVVLARMATTLLCTTGLADRARILETEKILVVVVVVVVAVVVIVVVVEAARRLDGRCLRLQ